MSEGGLLIVTLITNCMEKNRSINSGIAQNIACRCYCQTAKYSFKYRNKVSKSSLCQINCLTSGCKLSINKHLISEL